MQYSHILLIHQLTRGCIMLFLRKVSYSLSVFFMAVNSLYCTDVPLKNYSLTPRKLAKILTAISAVLLSKLRCQTGLEHSHLYSVLALAVIK